MAGRQDEPVAVGPVRIRRVILQMACEQRGRGVGHAHRHAGMAAVGGFDRIHRQGANGVGESALGRHEISHGSAAFEDRLADGLVPIVALQRDVNLASFLQLLQSATPSEP